MNIVVITRNRYAERLAEHRGERSPLASRVVFPFEGDPRAYIIASARRFRHRNPRRIPNGLSFEGDSGDVQTVTFE